MSTLLDVWIKDGLMLYLIMFIFLTMIVVWGKKYASVSQDKKEDKIGDESNNLLQNVAFLNEIDKWVELLIIGNGYWLKTKAIKKEKWRIGKKTNQKWEKRKHSWERERKKELTDVEVERERDYETKSWASIAAASASLSPHWRLPRMTLRLSLRTASFKWRRENNFKRIWCFKIRRWQFYSFQFNL